MPLKLTFVADEHEPPIEAEDATGVIDAWNASPWWNAWDPADFRQRIVEFTGAKVPGGMPASDDLILNAVVEAAGPNDLRLEEISTSIRATIRGALRR